MMPTAGKLVAAAIFGAGGYMVSEAVRPFIPEGVRTGWLVMVCIAVPLICGWRVVGNRVGEGYFAAISTGFYGVFVSTFFVFFTFAAGEMINRAREMRYDGVMEALTGIFVISLEYGVVLLAPVVLGWLCAIAVIGGLAAEWAFRRWQ